MDLDRKSAKMKIAFHFPLILAITCALGCSPKQSYVTKYGVVHNPERKKRGIPLIDPSWTIQDMGDYFDCFDPKPVRTKPHRLLKRVFVDKNGVILKEVDSFYSGKTFISQPPEQTRLPEEIVFEYDYLGMHLIPLTPTGSALGACLITPEHLSSCGTCFQPNRLVVTIWRGCAGQRAWSARTVEPRRCGR